MNMSKGLLRLPAGGIGPLLFERELETSSKSNNLLLSGNRSIGRRPAANNIRGSTFWNPEGSNPYSTTFYPPGVPEKASISYGDGAVGYEWIRSGYGGYSEHWFVQSLTNFKWNAWAINNNASYYGDRTTFEYPSNYLDFYAYLRQFVENFEETHYIQFQDGQRIKVWISIDMYIRLSSRNLYYPERIAARPIIDRYYDEPMRVVSKYRVYAS